MAALVSLGLIAVVGSAGCGGNGNYSRPHVLDTRHMPRGRFGCGGTAVVERAEGSGLEWGLVLRMSTTSTLVCESGVGPRVAGD